MQSACRQQEEEALFAVQITSHLQAVCQNQQAISLSFTYAFRLVLQLLQSFCQVVKELLAEKSQCSFLGVMVILCSVTSSKEATLLCHKLCQEPAPCTVQSSVLHLSGSMLGSTSILKHHSVARAHRPFCDL